MQSKKQELKKTLQLAYPGFAYEVLALQIDLEDKPNQQNKIESVSKLLQLYMIAVQCLQSRSDQRYHYFSNKIQILMKKRILLEEMQKTTKKKLQPQLLLQARRVELGERRQDYDLQMYLNTQQVSKKKIKQLVQVAETKIKRIENKVQNTVMNQDKELQQRIKRRKMRSEAGSVEKFKLIKGQVLDRNIAGEKLDQFFSPMSIKLGKRQPTSGDKAKVYI